jgi:hypothetical protein
MVCLDMAIIWLPFMVVAYAYAVPLVALKSQLETSRQYSKGRPCLRPAGGGGYFRFISWTLSVTRNYEATAARKRGRR